MPNEFKNARQAVGVAFATGYTVPASTTSILIAARATNVDGTNDAKIDARIRDVSGATDTHIAFQMVVPKGGAVDLAANGAKFVLETTDFIEFKADSASDIEVQLGILEIT